MLGIAGIGDSGIAGTSAGVRFSVTETTHRFATRSFATPPDDRPSNRLIEGRFSPPVIDRALATDDQGLFTSAATSTIADLELANPDGGLDGLADGALVDGRRVSILVGAATKTSQPVALDRPATAGSVTWRNELGQIVTWRTADGAPITWRTRQTLLSKDYARIYQGTAILASFEGGRVRIRMQDPSSRLRRPISTALYSGAGGSGGSEDLAGQTQPFAIGRCLNAPGVLIDPGRLIYQWHAGEMRAIDAVYDSGVRLRVVRDVPTYEDLEALVPLDPTSEDEDQDADFEPGEVITCLAEGCARLGGLAAGRVTADIRGEGGFDEIQEPFSDGTFFSDGTGFLSRGRSRYAGTVGAQILYLLRSKAGLSGSEIDSAQIGQIDREHRAESGLFVAAGEVVTVEDAVRRLAASINAVVLPNRLGRFYVLVLQPPGPSGVVTLTETQIESIDRADLPYQAPFARWRVSYARNWSPMTGDEVAPVVDASRRAFLERAEQFSDFFDERVAALHPADRTAQVDTLLINEADARTQNARRRELYGQGRAYFRLAAKGTMFRLDLGDTVEVRHPRYGLAAGRRMVVTRLREDADRLRTELTLFG